MDREEFLTKRMGQPYFDDYSWLKEHCERTLKLPITPDTRHEHIAVLHLIEHYNSSIGIPENATNREMIQAVFSEHDAWMIEKLVNCKDWMDAPFRRSKHG